LLFIQDSIRTLNNSAVTMQSKERAPADAGAGAQTGRATANPRSYISSFISSSLPFYQRHPRLLFRPPPSSLLNKSSCSSSTNTLLPLDSHNHCTSSSSPSLSSSLWSTMRSNFLSMFVSLAVTCLVFLQHNAYANPAASNPWDSHLDKRLSYTSVADFAAFEYPIALSGLLANIGPSGSKSSGAKSGIIIASPSTCE
jgi:hypothetical protein